MSCENFKAAIGKIAAERLQPEAELRLHLSECNECSAAFAFEQSLHASIDSGLRAVVNSEVPPSLLPNVRVRLQEESPSKGSWMLTWPTSAGAAFAVFAIVLVTTIWQSKVSLPIGNLSSNLRRSSRAEPPNRSSVSPRHPVLPGVFAAPRELHRPMTAAIQRNPAVRKPEIEVLVPGDQEILLASYAKALRRKNVVVQAAEDLNAAEPLPLQVDLIQIAQLDVKPLADETLK